MIVLISFSQSSFAQTILTGFVKDQYGMPIIGASVVVKGTTEGTVTNMNGSFMIRCNLRTDILVVSAVNYMTKEVPLTSYSLVYTITLDEVISDPSCSDWNTDYYVWANNINYGRLDAILPGRQRYFC